MTLKIYSAVGLVALSASQATANPLSYENDTGGSATVYGQLSPGYVSLNDGDETTGNLVDNSISNSRVGLNLDQQFEQGLKLRFKFETALGAPQSSSFSQDFEPEWKWEKTNIRKTELILSGDFGVLSLGQGSMASDGVVGSDFTKTGIAGDVQRPDIVGGYFIRLKNGDLSELKFGDVFNDFDGGRKGRIRYDTPTWNGLSVAVAYGREILKDGDDRDYYDVGGFYEREAGDIKFAASIGYGWKETDEDVTGSYAGSFSVLHSTTGLVARVAFGGDADGDGQYAYGKLGWIGDPFTTGHTALSVDYYGGSDFVTDGSSSRSWGIQAVQFFEDYGLETYLSYVTYSYDDDDANYEDANSVLAGFRWKF